MFHIILALGSILVTAGSFFSYQKFHTVAWVLFAGTIFSGIGIALVDHALISQVCTSGTLYSVVALAALSISRRRFVHTRSL